MYTAAPDLVFCVRLRGDEREFAQKYTASVLYQYASMTDMRGGTVAFLLPSLALDDRATE